MSTLLLNSESSWDCVIKSIPWLCLLIIIVTAGYLFVKYYYIPKQKYLHEKEMKELSHKHEKEWYDITHHTQNNNNTN